MNFIIRSCYWNFDDLYVSRLNINFEFCLQSLTIWGVLTSLACAAIFQVWYSHPQFSVTIKTSTEILSIYYALSNDMLDAWLDTPRIPDVYSTVNWINIKNSWTRVLICCHQSVCKFGSRVLVYCIRECNRMPNDRPCGHWFQEFAFQLLVGMPFLLTYPVEYLSRAFNLGRVFIHFW